MPAGCPISIGEPTGWNNVFLGDEDLIDLADITSLSFEENCSDLTSQEDHSIQDATAPETTEVQICVWMC